MRSADTAWRTEATLWITLAPPSFSWGRRVRGGMPEVSTNGTPARSRISAWPGMRAFSSSRADRWRLTPNGRPPVSSKASASSSRKAPGSGKVRAVTKPMAPALTTAAT